MNYAYRRGTRIALVYDLAFRTAILTALFAFPLPTLTRLQSAGFFALILVGEFTIKLIIEALDA